MEEDTLKRYNLLYLTIIMRYKECIEDRESISVAQLPTFVTPDDPAIVSFANTIKEKFKSYSYDANFYDAAKQAHSYIQKEILKVTLPVEFWLKPSETLTVKAGDTLDKATLLCSVLTALGAADAKILFVMKNEVKQVGVYCTIKDKVAYFDVEGGIKEFNSREDLLKEMGVKEEGATAYEFNNLMYADLT